MEIEKEIPQPGVGEQSGSKDAPSTKTSDSRTLAKDPLVLGAIEAIPKWGREEDSLGVAHATSIREDLSRDYVDLLKSNSKLFPNAVSNSLSPISVPLHAPGCYFVFAKAMQGKSVFMEGLFNHAQHAGRDPAFLSLGEPEAVRRLALKDGSARVIVTKPLSLRSLYSGEYYERQTVKDVTARMAKSIGRSTTLAYASDSRPVRRVILLDSIKDLVTKNLGSALGSGGLPLAILQLLSAWNSVCQHAGISLVVVANPQNLKSDDAEAYLSSLLGNTSGGFVIDAVSDEGDTFGPRGYCSFRNYDNRRVYSFYMGLRRGESGLIEEVRSAHTAQSTGSQAISEYKFDKDFNEGGVL